MKKFLLPFILSIFLAGCQQALPSSLTQNYQPITTPSISMTPSPAKLADNITATIKTNKGTMKVVLFPKIAPQTVANFIDLAKGVKINPNTGKKVSEKPYYDGVVFHRIVKGFMIQGGDPTGTGRGGPGYKFADEPVTEEYTKGTMAMANAGPNTNGSQFFIMNADYPLPKNYTIFGRIDPSDKESLVTLDKISDTPVSMNDGGEMSSPKEKILIESVTIEEK